MSEETKKPAEGGQVVKKADNPPAVKKEGVIEIKKTHAPAVQGRAQEARKPGGAGGPAGAGARPGTGGKPGGGSAGGPRREGGRGGSRPGGGGGRGGDRGPRPERAPRSEVLENPAASKSGPTLKDRLTAEMVKKLEDKVKKTK